MVDHSGSTSVLQAAGATICKTGGRDAAAERYLLRTLTVDVTMSASATHTSEPAPQSTGLGWRFQEVLGPTWQCK